MKFHFHLKLYNSNIFGIRKNINSENDNEDARENITAYKINAKTKNIEILERYPDKEAQLYYTLIRVRKENIRIDKRLSEYR